MSKNQFTGTATQPQRNRKLHVYVNLIRTSTVHIEHYTLNNLKKRLRQDKQINEKT